MFRFLKGLNWEWGGGLDLTCMTSLEWTFWAQNSSLRDLQAPLGQSFSCRNASIVLSPAVHLDLLSLRLQAAQLPDTGVFGPSKTYPPFPPIILPLHWNLPSPDLPFGSSSAGPVMAIGQPSSPSLQDPAHLTALSVHQPTSISSSPTTPL
jgi:hypothetical protein